MEVLDVSTRLGDEAGLMPFLFSYGTLQQADVQLSTFGRRLAGWPDQLANFEQSLVLIEDEDVIAKSGKTQHPIVKFTGLRSDRIDGPCGGSLGNRSYRGHRTYRRNWCNRDWGIRLSRDL